MSMIKIKYKDQEYEYESGTSLLDISKRFGSNYKNDIIAASINNRIVSLDTIIKENKTIDFYDTTSAIGRRTYIRGLYFLFIKAVKDVLNCDVKIMYFVNKGVYCEILTNNIISEVTVEKIKIRMRQLKDEALEIKRLMVSRFDAIEYFEKINQQDKAESLKYISNATISLYRLDDKLDYFYGVLPTNTSYIKYFNLKYINNNKVMLLPPITYLEEEKIKFDKTDVLLPKLSEQSSYLENIGINTAVDLNKSISTGNYGDVIRISETIQNNQLLSIADKIAKDKSLKVLLITGPVSSGKKTVSKKLELYLKSKGRKSILISMDDFHVDVKDNLENKNIYNFQKIEDIDTNLFNQKLSELLEGKEVVLPKYNFISGKQEFNDKNKASLLQNGIIIVEGLHTFNEKLTEMLPDKNKFKLFVNPLTPLNIDNHNLFKETDNRLLRYIIRNNKTHNMLASESIKLWSDIRKYEEENIYSYMMEADDVFNSSAVYELGVLKTYVEPLLFQVSEKDDNYDDAIRLINIFRIILGIPSDEVPNDSIIKEFIRQSCFKNI